MVNGQKTTDELLEILKQKKSFDEYLKEDAQFIEEGLAEYLDRLLIERKLKKADVIKKSQIDRNYAYQIFGGIRKPARDKILALGFGMGLNIDEIQRLLKVSENPVLYVKNRRDSIILFGIDKQVSLSEMNEFLYEMGENIIE